MVSNWSALVSKRTAPVFYVLGGIFYGSFVSLLHYAYYSLAQALLAWLSPLFFALFLYYDRREYKSLFKSFENTFLIATLVTGPLRHLPVSLSRALGCAVDDEL